MTTTQFRPSSFQILPPVIKNLLIINGLFFLAQNTIGKQFNMDDLFSLHAWQSPLFQPWQFITHLFMHGSFEHILFNMFALWMFGSVLENVWGPKRFLIFYFACGLGAALCHMSVLYFENEAMSSQYLSIISDPSVHMSQLEQFIDKWYGGGLPVNMDTVTGVFYHRRDEATLGASGAVFGCLAAFGYLFPNTYIYLYFFLPIKAKWFVIFYAGYELYSTIHNSAGDNIAHVAHLGGALVGIILVYTWNKTNRRQFY